MTLTSDGSPHCGTLVKSFDFYGSVFSTVRGWKLDRIFETMNYVKRVSVPEHRYFTVGLGSCNSILNPGSDAQWLESHEQFNPSIMFLHF